MAAASGMPTRSAASMMACRVQRTVSTRADALSPPGTPAADPAATGHDDGAPDPDGLPGHDSRDADRTHQLANEPQTDVERTGHQAKVTGQKPKASRRAYAGLIFVPPIVAAGGHGRLVQPVRT